MLLFLFPSPQSASDDRVEPDAARPHPRRDAYLSLLEGRDETWEEESRFAGVERFYARYTSEELEDLLREVNFSLAEISRDVADSAHTWLNFLAKKRWSPSD